MADSSLPPTAASGPTYFIGSRVKFQGHSGTVRFMGPTEFAAGKWIGVELDHPDGKNDGSVNGKTYFQCRPNFGVFVRSSQLRSEASSPMPISALKSPTLGAVSHPPATMAAPAPGTIRGRRSETVSVASTPRMKVGTIHPGSAMTNPAARLRSPTTVSKNGGSALAPPTPLGARLLSPTRQGAPAPLSSRLASPNTTRVLQPTSGLAPPSTGGGAPGSRLTTPRRSRGVSTLGHPGGPSGGPRAPGPSESPQPNRAKFNKRLSYGGTIRPPAASPQPLLERDIPRSPSSRPGSAAGMTPLPEPPLPAPVEPETPRVPFTPTPHSLTDAFTPYGSRAEPTLTTREVDELRTKLKQMEAKRNEDRQKVMEAAKMREEALKTQGLQDKLAAKVLTMAQDKKECERLLKATRAERDDWERKHNDILDNIEVLTLDREFAEQKAETYSQELQALNDKVEDLTERLELAGVSTGAELNDEDVPQTLEYATLQRQNDRLKEALVRLRDVTSEQEAEHQRRIKALEKELGQAPDYQNQVTELKGQLEQAETHIEDLKARLDDSMAAEDMVEQLSVRNLDLNEKVEEMKVVIEDLEALKELNDEMEENHVETEKQLQAELEFKDSLLRELQKKLEASDETMVDYEATIQQFRQLVQNLQSDLSDLRSRQAEQQTEAQELTSQSQAMLSLNMQLQSTVMKAQAKAIDLELRKLEAQQATEHLHFLEPYLPATFFQHENNAIRCLLLFKRLAFKSRLLTKQLDPRVEKSDNHITPHYLGTAQLRLGLTRLGGAAAQFVAHLTQCSPDTFLKFGFLYHDVMGIEKRLNTLLDHVRQEEVTPKAVLPEVQRSVHQLETLVQSHLPQPSPLTATETYLTQARALDLQAEVIFAQLILARQTLLASQGSEDSPNFSPEDHTLLHSEFFVPLDSLIQQCKAYKVASTKLLRRVRELGEEALMGILQFGLTVGGDGSAPAHPTTPGAAAAVVQLLTPALVPRFQAIADGCFKLAKYTQEARTLLVDYVANQQEDQTAPELSSIQNRLFDLSEQHLGQTETTLWTCAAKAFNSLNQEMSQVVEAIGEPTALVSYERTDAPWVQRAHQFKAELVLNVEVERKLQALNEEILNLIREVKLKDKALQESGVKIELLEKRMELVKKQADTIAQLEEKIQKGKEQQKMFEEAMEGLQNELEQLELENSKAKKAAARAEKLAARGKSGELDEVANMSSLEVLELKQRVDALASAVSYLRSENVFLKRSQLRLPTAATSTTAPSLPSVVRALEPLPVATLVHSAKTTTPQFNSLVSQTKSLYREVQAVSVSLKVIDITGKTTSTADSKTESSQVAVAPKPATVWQPFKTTPRYAFNAQQTLLNTLHHRSQALQDQVHALQKTSSARLRLPTLVSVASLVR
ncbi:hypothetical protein H4R33_000527 [Dimargaris cristalligena]|nr:hypothetical protein H4R33_000527 [Dimargaris cristalligena]